MQHDDSQDAADQQLLALSVAVAHPAISTDPRLLCAAACACKAWRQAVQQCSACNTIIAIDADASLPRLCSFTRWLPKHAPLVKYITSSGRDRLARSGQLHGLGWKSHLEAAQHMMQQALQLAAVASPSAKPPAATARSTSATPNSQQQQQQQQGLRLTSFVTDWLVGPAVLAALPAYSLTHLALDWRLADRDGENSCTSGSACAAAAALSRLSSLQHLRLGTTHSSLPSGVSAACCASIGQLMQLTSLNVYGIWSDVQQPLQQLMAKLLPLKQLHLNVETVPILHGPDDIDMSALTQLEQFSTCCLLQPSMVFPVQLRELALGPCDDSSSLLAAVMPLQQLSSLNFQVCFQELQALAQLAQLPALQQLSLRYDNETIAAITAAATAAAWPQLPQLQSLSIECDIPPGRGQLAALLAGLAGATQLQRLRLTHVAVCEDEEAEVAAAALAEEQDFDAEPLPTAVCACLTGLSRLEALDLSSSLLVLDDALALTALTSLTALILNSTGPAVTDYAATALACSLRQLRMLDLSGCALGDMVCLAAVGQLTQLTSLQLRSSRSAPLRLSERGLRLLTGLCQLQQLGVDEQGGVSAETWVWFWAAVGRQPSQRQEWSIDF